MNEKKFVIYLYQTSFCAKAMNVYIPAEKGAIYDDQYKILYNNIESYDAALKLAKIYATRLGGVVYTFTPYDK